MSLMIEYPIINQQTCYYPKTGFFAAINSQKCTDLENKFDLTLACFPLWSFAQDTFLFYLTLLKGLFVSLNGRLPRGRKDGILSLCSDFAACPWLGYAANKFTVKNGGWGLAIYCERSLKMGLRITE